MIHKKEGVSLVRHTLWTTFIEIYHEYGAQKRTGCYEYEYL